MTTVDVQREQCLLDLKVLSGLFEKQLEIEVDGDRDRFTWLSTLVFENQPREAFADLARKLNLGALQVARSLDRMKATRQIVVEFDAARDGSWIKDGNTRRQVRFCTVRPFSILKGDAR